MKSSLVFLVLFVLINSTKLLALEWEIISDQKIGIISHLESDTKGLVYKSDKFIYSLNDTLGLFIYSILDSTWQPIQVYNVNKSDINNLIMRNDNLIITTKNNSVLKSTSRGDSWLSTFKLNDSTDSITSINYLAHKQIWFSTSKGSLYNSLDLDEYWFLYENTDMYCEDILFFNNYDRLINTSEFGLLRCSYGNSLYISSGDGIPVDEHVQKIILEKENEHIYAITNKNHIYKSTDYGNFWNYISDGLDQIEIISLFPTPYGILTGTTQGIYFSADNGVNWTTLNDDNLNNVHVHSMVLSYDNYLYIGDDSGKIYKSKSKFSGITSVEQFHNIDPVIDIFPNPTSAGQVTLKFSLVNPGRIMVNLHEISGKYVGTLTNKYYSMGNQEVILNLKEHAVQGVYLISVSNDRGEQVVRRLIIE